mgnify:CR=1 FL=1
MANPQLENGYTKIANEILESFIGSKVTIPAEVRRVVDFIIRKTYGFGKKEDSISLSQFALATGLKKPSVIRAIKKALFMNLISRTANGSMWKYRFHKDFDDWRPLAPRLIVSPTANESLAPRLPTKETITKETTVSPNGSTGKPMTELTYESDESVTPIGKYKRSEAVKDGYQGHEVNPLFKWAEEKGQKFPNPIKQKTAIKKMLYAGYTPEQIKESWELLEEDEFWAEKGIDFGIVLNQIGKVKGKKKSNPLLYAKR